VSINGNNVSIIFRGYCASNNLKIVMSTMNIGTKEADISYGLVKYKNINIYQLRYMSYNEL
jgi:hypothetical protein